MLPETALIANIGGDTEASSPRSIVIQVSIDSTFRATS
jgi:hypothetical protein